MSWKDGLKSVWDSVDLQIQTDSFSVNKYGDALGLNFKNQWGLQIGNYAIPPIVVVGLAGLLVWKLLK